MVAQARVLLRQRRRHQLIGICGIYYRIYLHGRGLAKDTENIRQQCLSGKSKPS